MLRHGWCLCADEAPSSIRAETEQCFPVDMHIHAYAQHLLCFNAGTLALGVALTDRGRSLRSQYLHQAL
jgi:hypothetical protein